jgi:hypothetical protein
MDLILPLAALLFCTQVRVLWKESILTAELLEKLIVKIYRGEANEAVDSSERLLFRF